MKTKDAYLVGYYGMLNSGDDALMAATLWGVEQFCGVEQVHVSTPRHLCLSGGKQVNQSLPLKQRFRGHQRFSHYFNARHSERVIFGGGSVFHTAQDMQIKRHMLHLSRGDQHMAVGVGLGPFKNVKAEKACREFLRHCPHVRVRDQQSLDIAHSLGAEDNVSLSFDLAPLLLCRSDFQLQPIERSGIAVCLCPRESLTGDMETELQRCREMAAALAVLNEQTGEPVTLVDFNGHQTLGDKNIHQQLLQLLQDRGVQVSHISYDANPFRVLQRLAGFRVIVSMRLHGSILGYMAGTPVLSLNYHSKCRGWCEQIGMDDAMTLDIEEADREEVYSRLLTGLEAGFVPPRLSIDEAKLAALKNWQ